MWIRLTHHVSGMLLGLPALYLTRADVLAELRLAPLTGIVREWIEIDHYGKPTGSIYRDDDFFEYVDTVHLKGYLT